ncbi:MAG: hypothetical protein OXI83_04300 [Gemmatimonadota bacterium]|nr:hypothetical protein [Gemmatimonadota bacterium]
MQKGIGAAPFAIVAALIVALTVGFWATQPAQAAAVGDVVVSVEDVANSTTFNDPNDDLSTQSAFGPPTLLTETGTDVEAVAAKAGVSFRGAAQTGAHVEVSTRVIDAVDGDGNATGYTDTAHNLLITIEGEGSLSSQSTLTSATCSTQPVGSDGPTDAGRASTDQVCQFPVHGTSNAGGFTVTAADAGGGSILVTDIVGAEGSLMGQWVGPAVAGAVLTGAPAESAIDDPADPASPTPAEQFGMVSPESFLSGTQPGLTGGTAGFLFQLTDAAGQVALNTTAEAHDNLRVRVIVDKGDALQIAGSDVLSTVSGDSNSSVQYVDIGDEGDLSTGYPGLDTAVADAGGLIAVGIVQDATTDAGTARPGRIVLAIPGGTSVEHAFAIAGNPDGEMSTISAISGKVNLAPGGSHERSLTLRDANGSVVTGLPPNVSTDPASPTTRSAASFVTLKVNEGADITVALANEETSAGSGAYKLTITAVCGEDDTTADVLCDGDEDDDAEVGLHGFTVTIDDTEKTADEDGNPLEAHVGSGITGLAITSVTNAAGDELLGDNGEVTVGEFELITITLTATGSDGRAPVNDSVITPATGSGFVGTDAGVTEMTDDNGEVTITYGSGTDTRRLAFSGGTASVQLLVRVAAPGAEVDDGPTIYTLAESAGGTFHSWQGGDAASSVFENVANLVRVWWWSGTMWVGYNANPAAPAVTKSAFVLSNNDTLYVVANGEVQLSLD